MNVSQKEKMYITLLFVIVFSKYAFATQCDRIFTDDNMTNATKLHLKVLESEGKGEFKSNSV